MNFNFYKKSGEKKNFTLQQPPAGTIVAYAPSGAAPSGWLLCDGTTGYSTTTYASLYGVIGYSYGGSGGSFTVPNMNGKIPIGAGTGSGKDSSGTGAITGTALTARTLAGSIIGAESVQLAAAQSGLKLHGRSAYAHSIAETAHSHTISGTGSHTHVNKINYVGAWQTGSTAVAYTYPGTGGNPYGTTAPQQSRAVTMSTDTSAVTSTATEAGAVSSHTNVQPVIVMQYIIKT
jgi:microcystin-dependent protein